MKPNRRHMALVRASVISAAVPTAMFLFPSSVAAAQYPATAFTISPVTAAGNCATLEPGKRFGSLPCSGAPTQHFTYDSVNKHLVNGNGDCIVYAGRTAALTAGPCDGKASPPILVDANPTGQHISYVTNARAPQLCFSQGSQGVIGGQNCGATTAEDFAIKPVS
jgi:hypothetical protein